MSVAVVAHSVAGAAADSRGQPADSTPLVLQVEGLSFSYPQRSLFDHWSALFLPGLNLVRGGDGSGKSTLLRLLAGGLPAQGGALRLGGLSLHADAAAYRGRVFWMEPHAGEHDHITALDYLETVQRAYVGFDVRWLAGLTEGLALTPHLDKPLYMLSTGSKRKVWLAAAFASGAALTLLDQPLAALDKPSIRFVLNLLADAAAQRHRVWVVADHEAPDGLVLTQLIDLGC